MGSLNSLLFGGLFLLAGGWFALSLARRSRGWAPILPCLSYILLYYSGSEETPLRNVFFLSGLIFLLGTFLGRITRGGIQLDKRQCFLLVFVLFYSATFPMSISAGVGWKWILSSIAMTVASTFVGMTLSVRELRRVAILIVGAGIPFIVAAWFWRGEWIPGLPLDLEFAPMTWEDILLDRRNGILSPLMEQSALVAVFSLAGWIATSGKAGREKLQNRFSSGSTFVPLIFIGVIVFYFIISKFRFVLLGGGLAFLLAVFFRSRRPWAMMLSLSFIGGMAYFLMDTSFLIENPILMRRSLDEETIRLDVYRNSLKIFLESPFTGFGIYSNGVMMQKLGLEIVGLYGGIISGAHSAYMVILTEFGVFGFLSWVALWSWTLWSGFKNAAALKASPEKMNPWVFFPLFAGVYVLVSQFFHTYLFNPWVWYILGWSYSSALRQDATQPAAAISLGDPPSHGKGTFHEMGEAVEYI
jgi:O-antigen ligase